MKKAALGAALAALLASLLLMNRPPVYKNIYDNSAHGLSGALLKFLWQLRTTPFTVPEFPRVAPQLQWLQANREVPAATWLGHASFLLQVGGQNVLTDPHLSARASPVGWAGPKRVSAPGLSHAQLPRIDAVLISHNHYDHLDLPSLRALERDHAPRYLVPSGVGALLRAQGFARVEELAWWQSASLGEGRVTAVPVQHFSGRGARDRNRSHWAGFVLELGGRRVFFAGDTGYSKDFADIGERFPQGMDLALIPIGAYEPRGFMAPVHVNPEEAVRIHQDVRSRLSIGMHWGSFRLTLEPLDEPPQRLRAALTAAQLPPESFRVLALGETLKF